ncbi:hypothetical protein [Streptomyces sp. N50]|uniref:hypothetical protein n=1 Tax=Streptomyces sp. N50 TaxID=3081765 RepID=UPI00296204F7|nr:hypothetical protein [Streptomyces sp. N50]WOX14999.1 hypothetical protein R2B38_41870 [Streptomyces sp. N50]
MVMCEYFSAASDEAAVGVLDGPGGPDASVFDVLPLKGVDPVVVLARLEGILTDCTYDEARARPRSGQLLSDPEAEAAFVISVSDTLRDALATASDERLDLAAVPFAAVEELGFTPTKTSELLHRLSGLARRAAAENRRLYCWWAL